MDTNNKIDVTWKIAVQVFWSYLWRSLLFSILLGAVVGFVIGFAFGILGLTFSPAVSTTTGALCGIFMSIFAMKKILTIKYKKFSVVLVANK